MVACGQNSTLALSRLPVKLYGWGESSLLGITLEERTMPTPCGHSLGGPPVTVTEDRVV